MAKTTIVSWFNLHLNVRVVPVTLFGVAKMTTNHSGVFNVPFVIANGAPPVLMVNFNSPWNVSKQKFINRYELLVTWPNNWDHSLWKNFLLRKKKKKTLLPNTSTVNIYARLSFACTYVYPLIHHPNKILTFLISRQRIPYITQHENESWALWTNSAFWKALIAWIALQFTHRKCLLLTRSSSSCHILLSVISIWKHVPSWIYSMLCQPLKSQLKPSSFEMAGFLIHIWKTLRLPN